MLFLTPNQQRKTTQGNTPERKHKINALELERWWDLLRLTLLLLRSETTREIFTNFSVPVAYGRGLVLLR